jgi:hypothetical protein
MSWDFERMNELQMALSGGDPTSAGYVRILSGPGHPFHNRFNPGPGISLGYEDLKTIEAYQFLRSIVEQRQSEPGMAEALAVAEVQAALERSWQQGNWQDVKQIDPESAS